MLLHVGLGPSVCALQMKSIDRNRSVLFGNQRVLLGGFIMAHRQAMWAVHHEEIFNRVAEGGRVHRQPGGYLTRP